jgi:hypothetical protein
MTPAQRQRLADYVALDRPMTARLCDEITQPDNMADIPLLRAMALAEAHATSSTEASVLDVVLDRLTSQPERNTQ